MFQNEVEVIDLIFKQLFINLGYLKQNTKYTYNTLNFHTGNISHSVIR